MPSGASRSGASVATVAPSRTFGFASLSSPVAVPPVPEPPRALPFRVVETAVVVPWQAATKGAIDLSTTAMAQLVSDVERLAPLRAVWVRTTAVHTDTMAANYRGDAKVDDGSCEYTGVPSKAAASGSAANEWSACDAGQFFMTRKTGGGGIRPTTTPWR